MTARNVLGLACAAILLGGCALELPFDLTWRVQLVAPPCLAAAEVPMDLAEQAAIWSKRESVQGLHVDTLRLRVVSLGAANGAGSLQVALRYRPEGASAAGEADLTVMERTVVLLASEQVVDVPAPAGLDETILEALQGSGHFTLVVETDAEAPVDALFELELAGSVALVP